MVDYDSGYKTLFSHADMVQDLLQGFVREEWVDQVDFTSLEKVNGSYVTGDLRDREDDVVWRVRWGEEWLYVYLLLEFQATVDWMMSVRITSYVMLLYQDLVKSGQVKAGERLPPVLPVVLYNGKPTWTAAQEIGDLIATVPGGLDRYRPRMRYLLIDQIRYKDAELGAMRNLVAALFRLEQSQSPEKIREVVRHLIEWLRAPEQLSLRRAFTVMLGRVLLPKKVPGQPIPELNDLREVDAMLAETVQEWTKQWEAQGVEKGLLQGLLQGRQEGEAALLLRILQRRFGTLPEWVAERVRSAGQSSLESWGDRVLDARSLDEIFAE
ncbi:MAG: Rpn family recombination-promoting nuclease/putative transposase [Magnetococcales bacterium]|nr:Rpn family recombination-promoting nuclease/putative transposase [Magnetococcales bacterium]